VKQLTNEPTKRDYDEAVSLLRNDPKFIAFVSYLVYGNTGMMLELDEDTLKYEVAFRNRLLEIYKEMK